MWEHRGVVINVDPFGKFIAQEQQFDSLAEARASIDTWAALEAKGATTNLRLDCVLDNTEHTEVTVIGLNRSTSQPLFEDKSLKFRHNFPKVYPNVHWILDLLDQLGALEAELQRVVAALAAVQITASSASFYYTSGRIAAEDYPVVIKTVVERHTAALEGPPEEAPA